MQSQWAWVDLLVRRAKRECSHSNGRQAWTDLNSEHYQATERRCAALIVSSPDRTCQIVQDHFRGFGMDSGSSAAVCQTIHASPDTLRAFLMRNYFDEAEPPDSRPWISALTLAVAYFSGGFIPLVPYFAVAKHEVLTGLWWSIGVMAVVFGDIRLCQDRYRSWVQRSRQCGGFAQRCDTNADRWSCCCWSCCWSCEGHQSRKSTGWLEREVILEAHCIVLALASVAQIWTLSSRQSVYQSCSMITPKTNMETPVEE